MRVGIMQTDPMLRLLIRYVAIFRGVALIVPPIVRALALPRWVVPFALSIFVLGMPVADAAVWLQERR